MIWTPPVVELEHSVRFYADLSSEKEILRRSSSSGVLSVGFLAGLAKYDSGL